MGVSDARWLVRLEMKCGISSISTNRTASWCRDPAVLDISTVPMDNSYPIRTREDIDIVGVLSELCDAARQSSMRD